MHDHFNLSQAAASAILVASGLGAVAGVLLVGRIADRLIKRGHFRARIWMAAIAFVAAVVFLVPGFLVSSLCAAAILFFVGAVFVGGVNPPMEAARLDVMHSRLWGRAESVLSSLRYAFVAIAPLAFGYLSTIFGGTGHALGRAGAKHAQSGAGLGPTLALMLVALLGAGIALFCALKFYPRDVATAFASEETSRKHGDQPN
ncbi:MAG: MFS transporter, partial [Gammaproteobacteria bacterium]